MTKTWEKEKQEKNKAYNDYVSRITPTHNCFWNTVKAFVCGGVICVIGQWFQEIFLMWGMPKMIASSYSTLLLVLISVILTCFNLVGPIVKFAGAGYLVPITGFANAVAACALEYKSEGQVFGVGSKIFNIAGPVILYGIVSSWAFGMIYWIIRLAGVV